MKKYLSIAAFSIAMVLSLNSLPVIYTEAYDGDNKKITLSINENESKLPKTVALSDNSKVRNALVCSDFSIIMDGSDIYFKNAAGEAIYPILYDGVTYLPLRAVGELMGKNVNWDEKNKIISISGERDSVSSNSPNKDIGRQKVIIQERPDFTILIENFKKEFYSVSGERIYPILYNGSTYLPLRSIGEIMNKEVLWDSSSKAVTLRNFINSTVTDADSFNSSDKEKPSEPVGDNNLSGQDTDLKEAKEAALNHAGFKENEVTFKKVKKDYEDGRAVYEIEFYKDGAEYEYDVDAETNEVIKFDVDLKDASKGDNDNLLGQNSNLKEAKEAALNHAGFKETEVTFKKVKKDYEDGRAVYEIEFYKDGTEYEYEIDAETNEVIKFDADLKNNSKKDEKKKENNSNENGISIEEAKNIALKHANINKSDAVLTKEKKDYDDGIYVYEIEYQAGGMEYEFKINADTGKVMEYESEQK